MERPANEERPAGRPAPPPRLTADLSRWPTKQTRKQDAGRLIDHLARSVHQVLSIPERERRSWRRLRAQILNMPSPCESYYYQLHLSCGEVLAASFHHDLSLLHAGAHQFIADLSVWQEAIGRRPEAQMLSAAIAEYQFSLLAVVLGQYRQAFMSLRLSLELFLATVYFSANEFKLRQWLRGRQDIIWSSLIDLESGVFSKQFVGAFFEDLTDSARQHGAIAESVYRECSGYVHGNASTHSAESGTVVFQSQSFDSWHQKAKAVRLASTFALCARYVHILEPEGIVTLEPILLDTLGHLEGLRAFLGAPVENANG